MDWPGQTTDAGCDFVTVEGEGGDKPRAGSGSSPSAWGVDDTAKIEGPGDAPTTIKKTGVWEEGA